MMPLLRVLAKAKVLRGTPLDIFGYTKERRFERELLLQFERRVDELIESFDLTAMARSKPATLSGGQQQRVALARALACNPQVLLLDEPFAALHSALRRELREELKRVRAQRGVPAIMVSHDADDVVALADEVHLFDGGRVTGRLRAGEHDLRTRLA